MRHASSRMSDPQRRLIQIYAFGVREPALQPEGYAWSRCTLSGPELGDTSQIGLQLAGAGVETLCWALEQLCHVGDRANNTCESRIRGTWTQPSDRDLQSPGYALNRAREERSPLPSNLISQPHRLPELTKMPLETKLTKLLGIRM